MKHQLLCLWLLLLSHPLMAQYHIAEHILINEGLSNNYVQDIIQDDKGRFWIATESGLSCYNGVSFYSYNMSNTDLGSNMINCLWYDQQRRKLWVGTKGKGVCQLNPETGEVLNYNTDDQQIDNVKCITPMGKGDGLWIICHDDIVQMDLATGELRSVGSADQHLYFRCGVDDGNGNLILGSNMNGASVLNGQTHQLKRLNSVIGGRDNVSCVFKDHSGRIWLGMSSGLWFYQPGSTSLIKSDAVEDQNIAQIAEIDTSCLWITSGNLIHVLDLASNQVSRLVSEGDLSLPTVIQKVYQDRFGNIWLGSQGEGISFVSHSSPLFTRIYSGALWGIYSDGEMTWVGTRNHILAFRGKEQVRDLPIAIDGRTSFGAVLSINGDGANTLYLAVPYNLLAIDKVTGQARYVTTPDGRSIDALTFYREPDGTFWISATDGVYQLRDDQAVEVESISQALGRQSSNGIRRDRQGKLWVATYENGIYLFDSGNQLICHLSQQTGFFPNSIQHLKVDSHDRLWMSTPDGPCCIPDTRYPGKYVVYGYKDGLLDTYVRAIQEDREGNIWVSTTNGISMLSHEGGPFVNYTQADYIPVNNLTGGAILQEDGSIIFTSLDGLCHCDPSQIVQHKDDVSVNLMTVLGLATGQDGNVDHWLLPDASGVYHLDYDCNSFRLIFGSPDYAFRRYIEYEYKIDADQKNWIPLHNGSVTFRNLSSGHYRITTRWRLKGQPWNDDDVIDTLIYIHYPWWASLWARGFYLLLFVLAAYFVFLHYKHRLELTSQLELEQRKNIDQHERNVERLQFFTNITHELKTPLTLIQAPLEELLDHHHLAPEQSRLVQVVYDSSRRLTSLCNKLLDFRRSETHNQQLMVRRGSVAAFIDGVGRSFVELSTNPHLQIEVKTDPHDQAIFFDEEVLRSILTNLLSNALKYTPEGRVTLSQQIVNEGGHSYTYVRVSDTGYGIPADALQHIFDRYYQVKGPHQASGTGIGLSIVKSLAELHEAHLEVESQLGAGTTFTLRLDNGNGYPAALHREGDPAMAQSIPHEEVIAVSDTDQRPLLLLVEDDVEILNFMAESLSSEYRILKVYNGQAGCDVALDMIPDVIVSDVMMPVLDGIGLCRRLKNDVRTSHIPIVLLTAKDTRDDQQTGYESGADSYLTKPFSLQMLRARIQNLLQARARLSAWINARALGVITGSSGASADADPKPALSVYDQNFLSDAETYIRQNISRETILMEDLAQHLNVSHSTLYRKVKALTGLSGSEYIRRIRVLHSAELMRREHCNVSEAAYKCGFSSLPYFRTSFREVFGMTPSDYLKQ